MWMTSLAVVALLSGDSETGIAEAQARAAVAVVLTLHQSAPNRPSPPANLTSPIPWVRVYAPDFPCPVCEQVRADARQGRFPFRLIWGPAPAGFAVDYYPVFHWNDPQGRGRRWPPPGDANAYPGPAALVALWQHSQITAPP